jgi:hypothetical protein
MERGSGMAIVPSHLGVQISQAVFESVFSWICRGDRFRSFTMLSYSARVHLEFVTCLAITSLLSPETFAPGDSEPEMLCRRLNLVLEFNVIESLNLLI